MENKELIELVQEKAHDNESFIFINFKDKQAQAVVRNGDFSNMSIAAVSLLRQITNDLNLGGVAEAAGFAIALYEDQVKQEMSVRQ